MDVREFVDLGLLQEINRLVLHPLGLALSVVVEDDGKAEFSGVLDYRDDPEGMAFDSTADELGEKAQVVERLRASRREARTRALGYFVQPATGGENEAVIPPREVR